MVGDLVLRGGVGAEAAGHGDGFLFARITRYRPRIFTWSPGVDGRLAVPGRDADADLLVVDDLPSW